MATPGVQDLPPVGGFPEIRYRRHVPRKGPSGLVIVSALTLVCGLGFYRVAQGNLERRELKREKLWSRIHLVPMLMAESDRDAYRRQLALLSHEAEIMKDVEGWQVGESVYNQTKRKVMPSHVYVPIDDKK